MRISVWQQFSSNHSGGFSVIGQFKIVEEAEKAHLIIQDILTVVGEYYRNHPELEEELQESGMLEFLTPPEESFAKQYGLTNWDFSLDWAAGGELSRYHNLVFLDSFVETWLDIQPFDDLLRKLGAQLEQKFYGDTGSQQKTEPVVSLTCSAPSETRAAEIVSELSFSEVYSDGHIHPLVKLSSEPVPYNGAISNSGSKVVCKDIEMHTFGGRAHQHRVVGVAEFLAKLVAYLESQGCKDFAFSISGIPYH